MIPQAFELVKTSDVAAKLLRDSAAFFETISDQNPDISSQMRENALVFRQVSDLLEDDPNQEIGDQSKLEGTSDDAAATPVGRPAFMVDMWEPDAGDRIPFSAATPWRRCTTDEIAAWTDDLVKEREDGRLVILRDEELLKNATFWVAEPQFYGPDAQLLHIAGPDTDRRDGFYLRYISRSGDGSARIAALPRKSEPIHRVNRDAPLHIDGHEIDYLILFMHLVSTNEGMFRVLQKDTLTRIRDTLGQLGTDEAEETINALQDPRPLGISPAGGARFEASILYSGALFTAVLEVLPNGAVEMSEDHQLHDPIDDFKESEKKEDQ